MTCGLASHHNSFQFRDSRQDSLSLFSKCVVLTTNPSSLLFNSNVLIMSVFVNFKSRYIVVSTLIFFGEQEIILSNSNTTVLLLLKDW